MVHLIGVPFDSGGTVTGVARAPAALRAAGLSDAIRAAGVDVADRGDVPLGPTSSKRDPVSRIIAPEALAGMLGAVRDAVRASLRDGAFPVVIGGDAELLRAKFGQHAGLAETLLATGEARIYYGGMADAYWHSDGREGCDWIGRLLELVRSEVAARR